MHEEEVELNSFGVGFYNGICLGFGFFNYPEKKTNEFIIFIPFVKFAWIKQMVKESEIPDEFL